MWVVDLRWATIVLGACALAASSVAPGKGPFVLAVAGLWLGLDWLLRAEVLSGVTAVFAAMLAAAVLTAAIAIASRQPTIEPAIYRTAALPVVAGIVAALSAPAIVLSGPDGSAVTPPTSVTIIAAALPNLLAAVALLCGLSAALRGPGPVHVSRRFVWLAAVGTATLSVTAVASNGTAWAGLALPTGVLGIRGRGHDAPPRGTPGYPGRRAAMPAGLRG